MRFCVCSMFCCCNHLDEEERAAGCFTLFVFLVSCDCYYTVALPHGAVGWSAVCDCSIRGRTPLHFIRLSVVRRA